MYISGMCIIIIDTHIMVIHVHTHSYIMSCRLILCVQTYAACDINKGVSDHNYLSHAKEISGFLSPSVRTFICPCKPLILSTHFISTMVINLNFYANPLPLMSSERRSWMNKLNLSGVNFPMHLRVMHHNEFYVSIETMQP